MLAIRQQRGCLSAVLSPAASIATVSYGRSELERARRHNRGVQAISGPTGTCPCAACSCHEMTGLEMPRAALATAPPSYPLWCLYYVWFAFYVGVELGIANWLSALATLLEIIPSQAEVRTVNPVGVCAARGVPNPTIS
eukprot:COSAG01_NODE_319_length_18909_cov_32.636151_3_plen_139_part_00